MLRTEVFRLRLSPQEKAAIREAAAESGTTMSRWIRQQVLDPTVRAPLTPTAMRKMANPAYRRRVRHLEPLVGERLARQIADEEGLAPR